MYVDINMTRNSNSYDVKKSKALPVLHDGTRTRTLTLNSPIKSKQILVWLKESHGTNHWARNKKILNILGKKNNLR